MGVSVTEFASPPLRESMDNDRSHLEEPNALPPAVTKRAQQKRALILRAAMRHFAEHGYEATRVADIAAELGIAKGSVFQHFGSKDGLFFESYKQAIRELPDYLEVPDAVKQEGFFAVVRYQLQHREHVRDRHGVEYKVVLLGDYGSDLNVKKRINRFLRQEDPLGVEALVSMGIQRGEIRTDVDRLLISAVLQGMLERFEDALTAEQEREVVAHVGRAEEKATEERIEEFVRVLRDAIGARGNA